MTFTVRLTLDNAAFDDPSELAAILRELAGKVDGLDLASLSDDKDAYDRIVPCRDSNGNTVGQAQFRGSR